MVCLVLAAIGGAWTRDLRVVAGVVGGGLLVGLALWAIAGAVTAMTMGRQGKNERKPAVSRGVVLVKFFTRHVILALVAYVMMVRLHLDPVGMVVGVTSVVVAAVIEAARPR